MSMIGAAVVGFKNSGKTTLAVQLAAELAKRGRNVTGAKFSHHPLDAPDTDTARLAEVCTAVFGLGPDQTLAHWAGQRHLPDLLPLAQAGSDTLVVEGGKRLGWLPRILVLREPAELEDLDPALALGCYGPVSAPGYVKGLAHFSTVQQAADAVLERGFVLPGLDCGACGREDCRGLAADIVAGKAETAGCQARSGDLTVTVGGAPLGLNPFTARLMRGALLGILAELKGYAPGQEVEIKMN